MLKVSVWKWEQIGFDLLFVPICRAFIDKPCMGRKFSLLLLSLLMFPILPSDDKQISSSGSLTHSGIVSLHSG